jgi:hypothetical protein
MPPLTIRKRIDREGASCQVEGVRRSFIRFVDNLTNEYAEPIIDTTSFSWVIPSSTAVTLDADDCPGIGTCGDARGATLLVQLHDREGEPSGMIGRS